MYKKIELWASTEDRQSYIDDIRDNVKDVSGIVIMGIVEADLSVIPDDQLVEIFSISNKYNIPIYLFTSGHKDNPHIIFKRNLETTPNNIEICYWHSFYLTQTLIKLVRYDNNCYNKSVGYDIEKIDSVINDLNFKYKFICLNKGPKLHRRYTMDYLEKYGLIENNAISFRELNSQNIGLKYWKEKQIFLDQENADVKTFNQEIVPTQYQYSFMQLVTESLDDIFIISEKTAIPLFFNKPFLVVSCKHFHKKLQEMGFQLYDELFDYSFDDIDDLQERIDKLVQNINKYKDKSNKELSDLYLGIKDKLIYNKKLAVKYAIDITKFPTSWNKLATDQSSIVFPFDINKQVTNLPLELQSCINL